MSLQMVIAQRLVRVICEHCARTRRINPPEHEWRRVEIGDEVFVGHGVTFVNDRRPRAVNAASELQGPADWTLERTVVERGAVTVGGQRRQCRSGS